VSRERRARREAVALYGNVSYSLSATQSKITHRVMGGGAGTLLLMDDLVVAVQTGGGNEPGRRGGEEVVVEEEMEKVAKWAVPEVRVSAKSSE
jgi:hypothetical protein